MTVGALTADWERLIARARGEVSVQLHAGDGPVGGRRATSRHYAASTIKLAVLVAALAESSRGRLDLAEPLELHGAFPGATGEGFTMRRADDQDDASWDRLGERLPLSTLVERMIVESSNIATNTVVERIGAEAVHRVVADAEAEGLELRHLIGDEAAAAAGVENTATAASLARLMSALAAGRLLPPGTTRRALALLARQRHRGMIPAGLPPGTWSAGKPGWTATVDHDVALVRPGAAPDYVLAVCTTTGAGESAQRLVARISAVTWKHWLAWHAS